MSRDDDLPLFARRPTVRIVTAEADLDARFHVFHAANPAVYATLVRLARYAISRGRSRIGIRMLWERMRWEMYVETNTPSDAEPFKLNDHHTARYSRLMMAQEPDLAGLFETREPQ